MEELEKFQKVNECETFSELIEVVEQIGAVEGSWKTFSSEQIVKAIKKVQSTEKIDFTSFYGKSDSYGFQLFNYVTRTYGLRAKTIYLKMYAEDRNISI